MSYLYLPEGRVSDFSKVVISLWFRVPQAAIDAAIESFTVSAPSPLFNGIIPLVVMGTEGYEQPFSVTLIEYIDPDAPPSTIPVFLFRNTSPIGERLPQNPTIIGINCDPSYGLNRPVLYINFETNQKADVSSYAFDRVDLFAYADVSSIVMDITAAINGTNIYLDPVGSGADQWHHLLMSLEFPKTISTHGTDILGPSTGDTTADYVDSAARLFVALDDVDYTGFDLSDHYVNGSEDLHAIIPEGALEVAGKRQSSVDAAPLGGIPQYTLNDPIIPCALAPMGLPASPKYVDNIYRVELAEFQMWTGETLDTANRRAFVDARGEPVDPARAEILMGRKPDILLHGSNKWIRGENTGATGGSFTPVAGIEPYKPDPSLG